MLAGMKPPYCVYGNPFYDYAGFGNAFSVDQDGRLEENIQNFEYNDKSSIHGMVFDPSETYLYSADMWDDKIWTHKKDETGRLTLVGSVDAPIPGDHPRWVDIHPCGAYLYALMEAGNTLGVYVIDERTHMPVYTHTSFPLVPPGKTALLACARHEEASELTDLSRRPESQEDVSIGCCVLFPEWELSIRYRSIKLA